MQKGSKIFQNCAKSRKISTNFVNFEEKKICIKIGQIFLLIMQILQNYVQFIKRQGQHFAPEVKCCVCEQLVILSLCNPFHVNRDTDLSSFSKFLNFLEVEF